MPPLPITASTWYLPKVCPSRGSTLRTHDGSCPGPPDDTPSRSPLIAPGRGLFDGARNGPVPGGLKGPVNGPVFGALSACAPPWPYPTASSGALSLPRPGPEDGGFLTESDIVHHHRRLRR